MAFYTYEPLDTEKQQIRLLKIAQKPSGPIDCTVKIYDLDDLPLYSALSYTWGPLAEDFEIFLDGQPFTVRKNLFRFLETFRHEREDTYLWIDQICIAQSNMKERNHQVNLMSRIYSQCCSTIIWLCDDKGLYSTSAADFNITGKSVSLAPLIADAYFTRLWIVQEVLISPHVRVLVNGNVWVSWDAMRDCFKTRGWKPTPAKALVLPEFDRARRVTDLSWCIRRFSSNECEDVRDKVYGLQGLVHQEERLDVDYNKRPFDVWIDAVLACPMHKRFEILWHLGEDMGIRTADIVSLDSFLALLSPSIKASDPEEGKLVRSINVTIERKDARSSNLRSLKSAKRERAANDPDLEQKFWYPDLLTDDALLNPRKSHPARNRCHKFRFISAEMTEHSYYKEGWDVVQDITNGGSPESRVQEEERRLSKLEQRMKSRIRPLGEPVQYVTVWYFFRGENAYRYPCAPDWEAIFRLDPLMTRSIVERLRKNAMTSQENEGSSAPVDDPSKSSSVFPRRLSC